MTFRLVAVAVAVFSFVSLSACDSKTDANARNFGAALSSLFSHKNGLCLPDTAWPVDLSPSELQSKTIFTTGPAAQMAALESNGLVKSSDVEIDQVDAFLKPTGAKRQVKRYELTAAAKPFYQDKPNSVFLDPGAPKPTSEGRLCWATQKLDTVLSWEGPVKSGDSQEALVTYTYKLDQVASWAQKSDAQAAFPDIGPRLALAGSATQKRKVRLTNEGWEAPAAPGD